MSDIQLTPEQAREEAYRLRADGLELICEGNIEHGVNKIRRAWNLTNYLIVSIMQHQTTTRKGSKS